MPINVLAQQRRVYEVGRIRIGVQVPTGKGDRTRPEKLSALRFTARDETVIRAVAELYGGKPRQWEGAPTDDQWEVITTAREIGVVVPPGAQSVSQWMEMWSGGGCARRCDGDTEQTRGVPCLCPADQEQRREAAALGKACKPTTRVSVVLPDVPGLGVWRLESHGWNAAHELGGIASLLAATVGPDGRPGWRPAVLRLEKRRQVAGGRTREFLVPVLTMRDTVRQMLEGAGTGGIALPPAPANARAIEAAPAEPVAEPAVTVEVAAPVEGGPLADLVARVEACPDLRTLDAMGHEAKDAGVMDEFVTSRYAPAVGELIEMVEVFRGRQAELQGRTV